MKRMLMIITLAAFAAAIASAQPGKLEWSKGNAYRSDTVRTTSVKYATKNFGTLRKIGIINMGPVGGGSGYLWVGQIYTGGRADTSTTRDADGWYGAMRLFPASTNYISIIDIDPTVVDTIWMKSTDSVWVNIYQR